MSDDEGDYEENFDEDYDIDDAAEDGVATDESIPTKVIEDDSITAKVEDDDVEPGDEDEIKDEMKDEIEAEIEADAIEGDIAEDEISLSKPLASAKTRIDPILRDSNTHRQIIIVPNDERITSCQLNILEAARAIAIRAKQIETDPIVFVKVEGETDSVELAKKELLARKSPLILRRIVEDRKGGAIYIEEFAVNEMGIPPLD